LIHKTALKSNIDINERQQKHDQNYRLLGMAAGYTALLTLIGSSVYAGMHDHFALAGLLMGTTAIGAIGVFVNAHLKK
jgi:hypothetical protein